MPALSPILPEPSSVPSSSSIITLEGCYVDALWKRMSKEFNQCPRTSEYRFECMNVSHQQCIFSQMMKNCRKEKRLTILIHVDFEQPSAAERLWMLCQVEASNFIVDFTSYALRKLNMNYTSSNVTELSLHLRLGCSIDESVTVLLSDIFTWSRRILSLLYLRMMMMQYGAWMSTLGGACSAYGESSVKHAIIAGHIALNQIVLARKLGDSLLEAKCELFVAYSYVQRNLLKGGLSILRQAVRRFAHEVGCSTFSMLLGLEVNSSCHMSSEESLVDLWIIGTDSDKLQQEGPNYRKLVAPAFARFIAMAISIRNCIEMKKNTLRLVMDKPRIENLV